MVKKLLLATVLCLVCAPVAVLSGLMLLVNPSAQATCGPTTAPTSGDVPATSHVVRPLPEGTGVVTSRYGRRLHPITGVWKLHTGLDFAAPAGTPILAAADGRVDVAGPAAGYGTLVLITHTIGATTIASGYAHMYDADILVAAGDTVTAGQQIGSVGSSGYSTGPHLHFEIRTGGPHGSPINPEPWLISNGAVATTVPADAETTLTCQSAEANPYAGDDPEQMVSDPTSSGKITRRTAHVLTQVRSNFANTYWSCWSQRSGPSEHPLGRACDGTFGNSIGTAATGPALTLGWRVTNWLKQNAQVLGVEYLIWQGKIWSLARSNEGWRPYGGGGMHNPDNVTGGHYDHLHFTVRR